MLGELRIFEWKGTARTEQILPRPPVKTVIAAVRALDGRSRNDVYLYPKAGDQTAGSSARVATVNPTPGATPGKNRLKSLQLSISRVPRPSR